MTNWNQGTYDALAPALRERLNRIANAERDRRAGRDAVAIATIGEPIEWPARVVVALAHLDAGEGGATRALLEEGLDAWASEFGLGELDPSEHTEPPQATPEISADDHDDNSLDAPFESFELDRAFDEAETEVESMRNVNTVAEQILAEESYELDAASVDEDAAGFLNADDRAEFGVPAASFYSGVADESDFSDEADEYASVESEEAFAVLIEEDSEADVERGGSNRRILAKLEGWLVNLEARRLRLDQRMEERGR